MPKQGRDGMEGCNGDTSQKHPQAQLGHALPAFPRQWNFPWSYGEAWHGWGPVTLFCLLTGELCPRKELGPFRAGDHCELLPSSGSEGWHGSPHSDTGRWEQLQLPLA